MNLVVVGCAQRTDNMEIVIDEITHSAEETRALGIMNGDFVTLDPRTRVTESGFIKSRHLDDKACAALLLEFAARVKRGDELRFDALTFGVMGPADEMAKTTVRSIPVPNTPPAAKPVSAKPNLATDKFATQHSFAKKEKPSAPSGSGKGGLIVLAILAAVVIAAFIFKR